MSKLSSCNITEERKVSFILCADDKIVRILFYVFFYIINANLPTYNLFNPSLAQKVKKGHSTFFKNYCYVWFHSSTVCYIYFGRAELCL